MADFADSGDENENNDLESVEDVKPAGKSEPKAEEPFDFAKPRKMKYCPTCTLPPEFCEYGQTFEKCLPWILENCPEAVTESVLAAMMGEASLEDGEEVPHSGGLLFDMNSSLIYSFGYHRLIEPSPLIGRREEEKEERDRRPQESQGGRRDEDRDSQGSEAEEKICHCCGRSGHCA